MAHQRIKVSQDIVELITSKEADQVTTRMSRIYYRLLVAPVAWWVSNEVLRISGSTREDGSTTARVTLFNWLRVPPEESRKALQWLHDKGVITYLSHQGGQEIEITFAGLSFPE
jgi:hypothetical protein